MVRAGAPEREAVVRDETATPVAQGWGVFAVTGGARPSSDG